MTQGGWGHATSHRPACLPSLPGHQPSLFSSSHKEGVTGVSSGRMSGLPGIQAKATHRLSSQHRQENAPQ